MTPLESILRPLLEAHPEDAARAMEQLDAAEAARLLEKLPADAVSPVLERLAPQYAGEVLAQLGDQRTATLLKRISPRHAAVLLRHLQPEKQEQLLAILPPEDARRLRGLLRYGIETAGGMMDPQVTTVPMDLTVSQAVQLLRKAPRETLYYLYVADRARKLVGVLGIRELLLAAPQEPIERLANREVFSVPATMDREELARIMQQHKFLALPVVDDQGALLGVVRYDQVPRVVQEEAFEDLQRMVGSGSEERALEPVGSVIRKRLPWLYVNLLTAFLASAVVGLFSHVLAQVAALAVLLPVVAGQGGNAGAQSLAIVIRGLAVGELGAAGLAWRVLRKELLVGFVNGVAIAAVTGAVVLFWKGSPGLAAVISLGMLANMVAAGLAGAGIPLALSALGRDPAQSSSIFMTTVTDVVGFASFLGFATLLSAWLV